MMPTPKKSRVAAPRPSRLKSFLARVRKIIAPRAFVTSGQYWEERYADGGHSGAGSYGRLAAFKADIINRVIRDNAYSSVIEFGCGDGAQQALFLPTNYIGVDISRTAVEACSRKYALSPETSASAGHSVQFITLDDFETNTPVHHPAKEEARTAQNTNLNDLALSLDVIYHLVEDDVFDAYMTRLFDHAGECVVIYASDEDKTTPNDHVRHRRFTDWVLTKRPDWRKIEHVPNPYPYDPKDKNSSFADFHIYKPAYVRTP